MDVAKKKDYSWCWWLAGGALLLALIGVAVALNFNFGATSDSATSDTINIDNGDAKINWDNYPTYEVELSGSYNITAPGTYHLTGSIEDGGISVKIADNAVVRLILDNVSIKNSSGPAIACYSGDDLVIELVGSNYLEDGASYSSTYDEDVKGAVYSKADLTFTGDGSLTLKANYQDGIVSKDDLKFNGGSYNIVAKDDGIRGKDSVYIADGVFVISASGDGIKSTNTTDSDKGFVLIVGGEISIKKSYEGIEARTIIIDGGEIAIFSNDDGINATVASTSTTNNRNPMMDTNENSSLIINGGDVYVNAAGDGLDSNGYIYINGGKVVVDGPTNSGNGALDAGLGIVMNGGTAVAVGASGMAESLGANSSIYNISVFFNSTLAKGTKIEIKNSAGETILEHTAAKAFAHLAAGTAGFELGETYMIYVNGEEYTTFTISNITTTVGNGGYNMGGGPNQGGATGQQGVRR
ncbi:carbohydrate-binding domain-containing protein [Candidatus Saccharibacteria bacterium]|nr:carbohydrate-binding domain-containing protein [Candidatus Saccharibacteria bacterium]